MRILGNTIAFLAAVMVAASCAMSEMTEIPLDNHENESRDYTAIFTVRQALSGSVYFQVNDSTRLYPRNWQDKYERVQRMIGALTVYDRLDDELGYESIVLWADSIEEGTVTRDAPAGDPIDLIDDWMTGAEDGFLTLHYSTWWGQHPVGHTLTLVAGENPDDPYELRLCHLRNGDAADEEGDALVCFELAKLPDTGGKYVDLTLKWLDGDAKNAQRTFRFRSRSD